MKMATSLAPGTPHTTASPTEPKLTDAGSTRATARGRETDKESPSFAKILQAETLADRLRADENQPNEPDPAAAAQAGLPVVEWAPPPDLVASARGGPLEGVLVTASDADAPLDHEGSDAARVADAAKTTLAAAVTPTQWGPSEGWASASSGGRSCVDDPMRTMPDAAVRSGSAAPSPSPSEQATSASTHWAASTDVATHAVAAAPKPNSPDAFTAAPQQPRAQAPDTRSLQASASNEPPPSTTAAPARLGADLVTDHGDRISPSLPPDAAPSTSPPASPSLAVAGAPPMLRDPGPPPVAAPAEPTATDAPARHLVSEAADRIADALDQLRPIPNGGVELEIELEQLGRLKVRVEPVDGVLRIALTTDDPTTAERLERSRSGILAALQNDLQGGGNGRRGSAPHADPNADDSRPRQLRASRPASAPVPSLPAKDQDSRIDVLA